MATGTEMTVPAWKNRFTSATTGEPAQPRGRRRGGPGVAGPALQLQRQLQRAVPETLGHGVPGRDRRQPGGPHGTRRSGRGVDLSAAPFAGLDAAGRIAPNSQTTISLRRGFPIMGPPQPRMDNFPVTCRRHFPLRPRHCNVLQRRHVRPSAHSNKMPPNKHSIQVRMPATGARPRMLTGRGKMPSGVSNRTSGAVPWVSRGAQKGIFYPSLVCVQQAARLRNVAGSGPGGRPCLGAPEAGRTLVARC